jgi:hypothetical protein
MASASQKRIETFFDWFIRSEFVASWIADNDADFINEPERASRCYDAAEFGADGKTHAEVIQDWRDAFRAYVRDKHLWSEPERFMAAVESRIDQVELWHEKNGSLDQQIG